MYDDIQVETVETEDTSVTFICSTKATFSSLLCGECAGRVVETEDTWTTDIGSTGVSSCSFVRCELAGKVVETEDTSVASIGLTKGTFSSLLSGESSGRDVETVDTWTTDKGSTGVSLCSFVRCDLAGKVVETEDTSVINIFELGKHCLLSNVFFVTKEAELEDYLWYNICCESFCRCTYSEDTGWNGGLWATNNSNNCKTVLPLGKNPIWKLHHC